jgi:hypothetical protein
MKINVLKTAFNKAALAALALAGFAAAPAGAQNPNYAPGDLLLFFQQYSGTQTVMVNLGAATAYRDATANNLNFVNISGALTGATPGGAAFGSTWYEDPTIFWGLAAVRSNSTSTTALTNGEAGRTIYISSPRIGVGTTGEASSALWTVDSNGSMGTGSSNIIQMQNRLATQSVTTTLIEGTGASYVDDWNLFNILGTPTDSFGIFPGGAVQAFGVGSFGTIAGENAEGALDLNRILAASPSGTVEPGTLREGQYQGTFIISDAGSVSYIAPVPEPSTFALLGGSIVFGLIRRRRAQRD